MNPPAPPGPKFLAARQRISLTALAFSIAALLATSASAQLQWNPGGATTGAEGGTGNWLTSNGGSPWWTGTFNVGWTSGSSAIFAGTGGTVDAGGVTVGNINFNTAGYTLQLGSSSGSLRMGNGVHTVTANADATISISIADVTGLPGEVNAAVTKEGTGTLTLSGINNYGGNTTINQGTLAVSGGDAIPTPSPSNPNAGAVQIGASGTLQLLANETITHLTGAGTVALGSNTLTVDGAGGFGFGGGNFSGAVTGSGTLVHRGGGPLILTGMASSFTGGVTVTGNSEISVVSLTDVGTNSSLGAGGTINLLNNGLLNFAGAGSASTNRPINLGEGGGRVEVQFAASALALTGNISGSGSLTLARGTLRLSGTNDFTGAVTVGGKLQIAGGSALPDNARVTVTGTLEVLTATSEIIGSLAGTGAVDLGPSSTLQTGNDNTSSSYSGTISGAGSLIKLGLGTLNFGNSGTYSGPTLINAGTLSARLLTNGAVTVANGATYNSLVLSSIGSLAGAGSVDLAPASTLTTGTDDSSTTFSGIIKGDGIGTQTPGGSLVKAGSGTFTLTGANTYQGSTTVSAGTLELGAVDTIAQSSNVMVEAAGTLRLLSNQSVQRLNGAGSIELGANTLSFKNTTHTSGVSTGGSFAGIISGTGSVHVTDTSVLTLGGNNSFTGGFTIGGGSTVTVPVFGNAGIDGPLGPGSLTVGDSSGSGGVLYSGASDTTSDRPISIVSGLARLGVTSPTAELTLSGAIIGTTRIDIFGPGRMRLLGDKAFSGRYVVQNGGTLRLEGDFSANLFSVFGTLETVGSSRSVGALSFGGASGILSPGGSGIDATLNTANLNLTGGVLALDLRAAGHDQLSVTGTVTLDAPVGLALQLDYDLEDFVDVLRLIVNDDSDAISFLNANARFIYGNRMLQEGDIFLVSSGAFSQQFEMRYGLDGDNDVRLVAMPEPGVAGLFAVAGLGLLARRRKIPRDKFAAA